MAGGKKNINNLWNSSFYGTEFILFWVAECLGVGGMKLFFLFILAPSFFVLLWHCQQIRTNKIIKKNSGYANNFCSEILKLGIFHEKGLYRTGKNINFRFIHFYICSYMFLLWVWHLFSIIRPFVTPYGGPKIGISKNLN